MNTDLVAIESLSTLDAVRAAIARVSTPDEAMGVVGRVRAAKAWLRAYGQLRDHRLSLLALEVEALVKVIQLGGGEHLTPAERRAGEWLASLTEPGRRDLVTDSRATVTTAEGLVRAARRDQEERGRSKHHSWAGSVAASSRRTFLDEVSDVLDHYTSRGVPFTVAEMADSVYLGVDEDFTQGVREVCRRAVRTAAPVMLEGTSIPRFVSAQVGDGTWVRIPTMNATIEDIRANIAMREEQLRADTEALDRMRDFLTRLERYADSGDAVIADVIEASLRAAA